MPLSLRKKCPNTEFFLTRIFLYPDWIQENTDQKKLRIWTLFMHCSLIFSGGKKNTSGMNWVKVRPSYRSSHQKYSVRKSKTPVSESLESLAYNFLRKKFWDRFFSWELWESSKNTFTKHLWVTAFVVKFNRIFVIHFYILTRSIIIKRWKKDVNIQIILLPRNIMFSKRHSVMIGFKVCP